MRRIKLVLAAAAVMVAMLAVVSGPAMADDLNCRDARGDLIRCDGQYYAPVNNDYYYNYPYYYNVFSPYFYDDFYNSFYYPYYYGYDY